MSLLPVGFGSSVATYEIGKNLRFRSSASAYLSRTFAGSGTDKKKGSFSCWVKRGSLGAALRLVDSYDGSSGASSVLYFSASDQLIFDFGGAGSTAITTSAVYRDPSAHFHVLLAYDTTQATASDRVKLYVSGTQVTSFASASYPALNALCQWFSANANNRIASNWSGVAGTFFDGHLSEINFIDGQALDPTSFGEFDPNGIWVPKKYAGTYGTNGFYLPFNDGTNLTNLCLDRSGNANNFTASGISLTAGVTYDWMDDTPTNNFATLNPLSGGTVPSNANLTCIQGASWGSTASTIALNSGKWYFEAGQSGVGAAAYAGIGLRPVGNVASGEFAGSVSGSYGAATQGTTVLNAWSASVQGSGISGTYTSATVFRCAVDFDAGKVWLGDGTNWIGGGNPASGTSPTYTFTAGTSLCPYVSAYSLETSANFGQRPFTHTPPTGFKAISTKNLPSGASITTSGSFTGNALADGPFVWLKGNPSTMTINGNAVTWGTHADKTAGGFKVRTSAATHNTAGSNTYSVTVTGKLFGDAARTPNTAQGNP